MKVELTCVCAHHKDYVYSHPSSGTQVPGASFSSMVGPPRWDSGCMEAIRAAGLVAGLWPLRKSHTLYGHSACAFLGSHPEGHGNFMAWSLPQSLPAMLRCDCPA